MKTTSYTLAIVATLALVPGIAAARQNTTNSGEQSDSVAAAARATRQQKQDKPAPKVWDNDNVPKQGGVSVVGQEAAPAPTTSADQNAAPGPAPANSSVPAANGSKQDQAPIQANLDAAKKQLDSVKADMDTQQRRYALDQQSYYGKTNYQADTDGAAALQGEKDEIDAKQQQLDDLQKKIDDLTAKLGTPPAPPGTHPD